MTSTDLVRADDGLGRRGELPPIGQIQEALRSSDASEAREIHARAEAFEVLSRRRGAVEAYHLAGAAKLWAERRIGELRLEYGKSQGERRAVCYVGFDTEIGVEGWHLKKWTKMALIPERRFEAIIDEIKVGDGALNAHGVLSRDNATYEVRIERGIYRIRDDRLCIQWKRDGKKHREILRHGNIAAARRELAVRTGRVGNHRLNGHGGGLDRAYGLVRQALQVLDSLDKENAEARKFVNQAMARLHDAEDEIIRAIHESVGRK
jgi:hypothetical protein